MKNISILGSTGSIGIQTLEIIRKFQEKYSIKALSAGKNIELLAKQVNEFNPEVASVSNQNDVSTIKNLIKTDTKIYFGDEGNKVVATHPDTNLVVSSIVGFSGLIPTLEAIRNHKDVAIANKESLVVAGELLISEANTNNVNLFPIDSEHSAIFQALKTSGQKFLKRVIITASGGPFRKTTKEQLNNVTVKQALNHPTWNMGKKITIDSATLMNKGFEVIETRWFFDIPLEKIDVWIHPQSIVHSMVEYIDGSFIAHLGAPDMRIPIAYTLSYPERLDLNLHNISPSDFSELTFEQVDLNKFEALKLAIESIKMGGTFPAVLNAANEIAVNSFLNEKIKFTDIVSIISNIMDKHDKLDSNKLENILEADRWARSVTNSIINN